MGDVRDRRGRWRVGRVRAGLAFAVVLCCALGLTAALIGRMTAVPVVLIGLLVAFLLLQGLVDRRDPQLAHAPLHPEQGLEFGERPR